MKTRSIFYSGIVLLLCGCGLQQNAEKEKEFIPILSWYSIPAEDATPERYMEMKEAGITHNFSHLSRLEDALKSLDLAEQAGVKVIFTCNELEKDPEGTVEKVKNHPALAGYFLRDEPGRKDFPALGEWARRIISRDSTHFCYLNLLPTYASPAGYGTPTYREYVHLFIKEVPIQLLSFDAYPVGGNSLREDWYENLEIFSDEARKAEKPFWAFALATAHDPYPVPTVAQIKLQMYSNLAYGAQGLQYFTYWNPDTTHWNFHEAPVTLLKKRSSVYDMLQEVNAELQNRAYVFMRSRVLDVFHAGDSVPEGTKPLGALPSPVVELDTHGAGAVVSLLEKEGNKYLVIVNRSFDERFPLTIRFDGKADRIRKDGSSVPADNYMPTLLVGPGEAEIFTWKSN